MPNETITDPTLDGLPGIQLAASGTAARGSKEHRSEPRFLVKWPATVIIGEQHSCRGMIKDISVKGAAVLLDVHLRSAKLINLHIHLPRLDAATGARIIEVYGKIIYSIHDSNESLFRTGISFLKFSQETDQAHLGARLTSHHVPL
jgi:hypothetical protein